MTESPESPEVPELPEDEDELRAAYAAGRRDFTKLKMSGGMLRSVQLTDARLDGCVLDGADLSEASLIEASLKNARLVRTDLTGAKLWAAVLDGANLRGADLSNASLVSARLQKADLRDAQLTGANLSGANALRANLIGAQLIAADAGSANFLGANFSGAQLMEADFAAAKLWQANLSDADLRNARLPGASMIGAKLDRADLEGANLHAADLSEASMLATKINFPADDLASALGCRVDFETYEVSGWNQDTLEQWIDAGASLVDRDRFPQGVLEELESQGEGLTLFFRSPLEPFDRFLIDVLIFSVLGPASLCRAVEVLPLDNRGFVRLLGPDPDELFALGDAIAGSIWRSKDPPHLDGLVRLPDIYDALERLAVRLERVQLRSPRGRRVPLTGQTAHLEADGGTPDLEPPAEEHKPGARPLTTVRTWRF